MGGAGIITIIFGGLFWRGSLTGLLAEMADVIDLTLDSEASVGSESDSESSVSEIDLISSGDLDSDTPK